MVVVKVTTAVRLLKATTAVQRLEVTTAVQRLEATTAVRLLKATTAGRSSKVLMGRHMRRVRGEPKPWRVPEGTELLKVPTEARQRGDPVGLMRKGHMVAAVTTMEAPTSPKM